MLQDKYFNLFKYNVVGGILSSHKNSLMQDIIKVEVNLMFCEV